jgi:hypothetical protein
MIRRIVVCLLITALLHTVPPAEAQQPKKVPRIGYLSPSDPAAGTSLHATHAHDLAVNLC